MALWLCMCIVYVHVLCLCCLFIFIYLFHNIFIDLGIYLLYMSYQQYLICYLHIKEPFGIKSSLYFFSSLKIQSHKVQTHHQWFLSSSISVSRMHGYGYENFIYRMIDTSGLPWDEAIFHAAAAGPARVLWRGVQPPGDWGHWRWRPTDTGLRLHAAIQQGVTYLQPWHHCGGPQRLNSS